MAAQVAFERQTTNSHAESLDTQARVVLGFAGVLVDNLTASAEETKLELLDTEILMVEGAASLVRTKGRRIQASVASLALGASLVVAGTVVSTGGQSRG